MKLSANKSSATSRRQLDHGQQVLGNWTMGNWIMGKLDRRDLRTV